jgi:cell wall-associated NlpC family hydrolase
MSQAFDPRTTPARPDLAAASLRGSLPAARYVEGEPARIAVAAAPMRFSPDAEAPMESEALMGEAFTVYERAGGWAWGQLATDGYVGYLPEAGLGPAEPAPTHRVASLRTPVFARADIKSAVLHLVSMNALLAVEREEGPLAALAGGGFVAARHLKPIGTPEADFVATAARFVGTPYVWGGRTSLGLDCSGLVQLALQAAGHPCPRDSDMMARALGEAVPLDRVEGGLDRGDFLFWPGHVAIVTGKALVHASAHHMETAIEPLASAIMRIAGLVGPPTALRRIA